MKKNPQVTFSPVRVRSQAGVTLIELMIALLIAGLIALGLVQIFGASSATSQMTEGLSRVQESGRFATQYLQRQLRMVGFMGCGADTGRIVQESFVNHLAQYDAAVPGGNNVPGGNAYRFQRPLEAFTAGPMTPPTELAASGAIDGSDVLILRVFTEESTPVVSVTKAANRLNVLVGDPGASFLPDPNETVLFGMENCRSADVFAGSLNGTAPGSLLVVEGNTNPNVYLDPSVSACGTAPCPWDFRISNAFLNAKPLVGDSSFNAEIHRAEYYAFFVRNNPAGIPSLYMWRFERDSTFLRDEPEELVEGVENMQLRFGVDNDAKPDGRINVYQTAAEIAGGAGSETALDAAWSRVLSVRIGMLIRSPGRTGAPDRLHNVLDVGITPTANDGAIREVYETTVALRNRLFKS